MNSAPLPEGSLAADRYVKEGKGWRLGWDSSAHYCGLIAGHDWAMELTAEELEDFCRLALQLSQAIASAATELMDSERITCEAETERLWLAAEGFPTSYSLRIILLTGRRGEGTWHPLTVPGLLNAIRGLTIF